MVSCAHGMRYCVDLRPITVKFSHRLCKSRSSKPSGQRLSYNAITIVGARAAFINKNNVCLSISSSDHQFAGFSLLDQHHLSSHLAHERHTKYGTTYLQHLAVSKALRVLDKVILAGCLPSVSENQSPPEHEFSSLQVDYCWHRQYQQMRHVRLNRCHPRLLSIETAKE